METQTVLSTTDGYEIVKVFGLGDSFYRVFHNNAPKGKFCGKDAAKRAIETFREMI